MREAEPTAVRKTVTVLFADLGGSTSFGERTDAELAREVMARYHAILQEVIDAHGGTVAKFMGDGMMATFGIPEIAEDDARAVRAGAELQQRFFAFATEVADRHGEILTLRVGINTGEVVIADGDADLIGDALNVAARLEKACRPGHVLVGEETWRITRGEFGYEALGEVTVAGRAAPVAIYEVAAADVAMAEPVAPFVGRALEMERLQAAFARAASTRSPLLTTVLGSPGLGKTRLSRELANRARSRRRAITFEIRCDRAGDATFAPIAQLIREAAGIGDDTEAEAAGARERIAALFPAGDADRERLVDVLAGVFGAAPARSVEETFWAIRRLVESLAASRPLVIVIDDIQWAEPKLLDLLEHLAEWVTRRGGAAGVPRPAGAARGAAGARRDGPARRRRARARRPRLRRDRAARGRAARHRAAPGRADRAAARLDRRQPAVRARARAHARGRRGHPPARRRRVGAHDRRRRGGGSADDPVAARGARRTPPGRRAPGVRARVGDRRRVQPRRACASSPGRQVAVPSLLEAMRRKELVEPTGTYWGDEPVHRFHHVLIRDAAYRRLLKTRADLHQRVGEWTDASAANLIGEHEAAIAYHYEQAYAYRRELGTVDADAERVGRRAAELLSIAAQRALGRDDLTSAGALAPGRRVAPGRRHRGTVRAAAHRVRVLPRVGRRRRRRAVRARAHRDGGGR